VISILNGLKAFAYGLDKVLFEDSIPLSEVTVMNGYSSVALGLPHFFARNAAFFVAAAMVASMAFLDSSGYDANPHVFLR